MSQPDTGVAGHHAPGHKRMEKYVMSLKALNQRDATLVLDALAAISSKKLKAAQLLGGLRAKGYAVSRMADVHELLARFQIEHARAHP